MSARKLLAAGGVPWARSALLSKPVPRLIHNASSTGGLLRHLVGVRRAQRRPWPFGAYAIHNIPAVRNISFARSLPKLATKLLRVPAMFGGAAVAGLAYIQYQATRK